MMTQSSSGRTSDSLSDLKEKASDRFGRVAAQGEDMTDRLAEHEPEAGERMQEVTRNLKNAIENSFQDQPMATLAVAAAIGFILGALWKS
jgi:ElaB/YqjD/DUF883 family membrane-anchored ribosome-binding protein